VRLANDQKVKRLEYFRIGILLSGPGETIYRDGVCESCDAYTPYPNVGQGGYAGRSSKLKLVCVWDVYMYEMWIERTLEIRSLF